MIRLGTTTAALGLALLLAAGCRKTPPTTATRPLAGEFTLKVVNHGRLDVTIYLVHGGVRDRIGESLASASNSFQIPMRRLSAGRDFFLFGDPIGSTTTNAQTETLVAEAGAVVIWTLEDDLKRSTVEIR